MKEFKRLNKKNNKFEIEECDLSGIMLSISKLNLEYGKYGELDWSSFLFPKKDIPELIEYLQQFVEVGK